jgi:hypothetical protein
MIAVLEHVDVLPQTSLAVNVLVWLLEQLVLTTDPSLYVTVGVLQPSVAVAVPNAPSIAVAVGLHPSDSALPVGESTGGVRFSVHVAVLEQVDVLPQTSRLL